MVFKYPKQIRFTCSKCALCCGDTSRNIRKILLLKDEADQIARITAKKIDEFSRKIEGSEPYVYIMAKTDQGNCIFLKERHCTIYEIRPLICRFYPFRLENQGRNGYVFTYTNECPSIGEGRFLRKSFFKELLREAEQVF